MMNVDNQKIFIKKQSKEILWRLFESDSVIDRLSYSRCSTNIRAIQNQIQSIRKEHLSLKDFFFKDIQNWKTYFQTTGKSIQKGIDPFTSFSSLTISSSEIQTISDQLMNYQTEIKHSQHQLKYSFDLYQ